MEKSTTPHIDGIPLRDWFAGQVVGAVFASSVQHNNETGNTWPVTLAEVAEKSYRIADVMLAARQREIR